MVAITDCDKTHTVGHSGLFKAHMAMFVCCVRSYSCTLEPPADIARNERADYYSIVTSAQPYRIATRRSNGRLSDTMTDLARLKVDWHTDEHVKVRDCDGSTLRSIVPTLHYI